MALHSDGERSSVIPVGLLNADGPRIAIPVNSVGLFSWASDTIRHSDQAQQEQVFLTLDISGATQPAVTGNVCWKENAVWGPPSTTFGVSMTSDDWCTTAEPPSILFTSMLAEQQQRIAFGTMNVSRIVGTQNRLFIAGSYSNSIDLVSTPLSPDVSNSNSSYDGIVLLFHPQGTEQAVFTTESSDAAHVSDIATLSNGAVLAIRGHGTLSGVNGAPTLADNDWLIVSAHQLTVSVDHDTLYLKRGFDPDEKTFVYDLCGRSLGYIPTVRNAWEYLEQGVYLLRQEQTLSLCHVGSHNVSFALPTGASR